MTTQLTLPFQFNDEATFANFVAEHNGELVYHLRHLPLAGWDYCYLWGPTNSGKSHLLQAASSAFAAEHRRVRYLNLAELSCYGADILQGSEQFELVVWDDVTAVAGNKAWEESLFASYNELMTAGCTLLVSADRRPVDIGIHLPDLTSRLQAGAIFALKPLSDEGKISVLAKRAQAHGLILNDDVANYLLAHHQRDLPELLKTLDRLDKASFAEKRRLTIPFVKSVLALS